MTEAVQQNDEDNSPPTWAEMRENGSILVDEAYDKLAVYVGGEGHVVIAASQSELESEYMAVHCTNVPALIKALSEALPQAVEEDRQTQALWEAAEREYEAHVAGQPSADSPV